MSTVSSTRTSPPADRTTLQKYSESHGSFDQKREVSNEKSLDERLKEVKKQAEDFRKAVEEYGRTLRAVQDLKAKRALKRAQGRRQLEKNKAECRSAERYICAALMYSAIRAVATPTDAPVPPGNRRLPQQSQSRGRGQRRSNGLG